RCGEVCIDPMTDDDYCGATLDCEEGNAGVQCEPWEQCNGTGTCELYCQTGLVDCDGFCVDSMVDPDYCGATGDCQGANAGVVCGAGEYCDLGVCTSSCPGGLIDCNGTCVDPLTDRTYCGASGDCQGASAGTTCAPGQICDGTGNCALSCQAGLVECNGTCVDPLTNRMYCGASGDCQGANAGAQCGSGEICVNGQCEISCPTGQLDCGGFCVNPLTDEDYCGASGDCQGANAGQTCAWGQRCVNGSCVTN
ncbi:unnamed protein product, partial [marine sediment metagenome]